MKQRSTVTDAAGFCKAHSNSHNCFPCFCAVPFGPVVRVGFDGVIAVVCTYVGACFQSVSPCCVRETSDFSKSRGQPLHYEKFALPLMGELTFSTSVFRTTVEPSDKNHTITTEKISGALPENCQTVVRWL